MWQTSPTVVFSFFRLPQNESYLLRAEFRVLHRKSSVQPWTVNWNFPALNGPVSWEQVNRGPGPGPRPWTAWSKLQIVNQRIEDGTQFDSDPADPVSQRRTVEINAQAAHDLGLPIKGKMIRILRAFLA